MHALQTMDRLKYFLDREGVEYNELLFDTDVDLGPNPFVRSSNYNITYYSETSLSDPSEKRPTSL